MACGAKDGARSCQNLNVCFLCNIPVSPQAECHISQNPPPNPSPARFLVAPALVPSCSPIPITSWSNLCVSRWRLGPEQRHAEIWRVPDKSKSAAEARAVVSPPAPPPSWRSIYNRLHRNLQAPTGAFSPSHTVIGRSVQEVRVRRLAGAATSARSALKLADMEIGD